MAYSDVVLADSPALYWRLGESSGTNANDETANNRDGTYTGGFTLGAAGALAADANTAVDLDGTDGRVTSSYVPFVAGSSRTFELWLNRDTQATPDAIFGASAFNGYLRAQSASRDIQFTTDTGSSVTFSNALPTAPTGWQHVVLTYNDATRVAELFVGGNSLGQQTAAAVYDTTPGTTFVLGTRLATTDAFDGKLDEFAVYESILSSARIAAHYTAGRPVLPPAPTISAPSPASRAVFSPPPATVTF